MSFLKGLFGKKETEIQNSQPAVKETMAPDAEKLFQDARVLDKEGKYAEALKLFLQAAEQGHAAAQNSCGNMYEKGDGTPVNIDKAIFWYEKSVQQGNDKAQCNLGRMYENGDGVPVDKEKALYLYEQAAMQGHRTAQFRCGLMYYGDGCSKRCTSKDGSVKCFC